MSVLIPLRNDLPYFDLQVELDGLVYTLIFRWNERQSAWFLDVLNEDSSQTLMAGIRCVVNFPLRAYTPDRQPPGALVFVDTEGLGTDPRLTDLGARIQLLYYTAEEIGIAPAIPFGTGTIGTVTTTPDGQTIIYIPGPAGPPGPAGSGTDIVRGKATITDVDEYVQITFLTPFADATYLIFLPGMMQNVGLDVPTPYKTQYGFRIYPAYPINAEIPWLALPLI